jgi:hypothetical protein
VKTVRASKALEALKTPVRELRAGYRQLTGPLRGLQVSVHQSRQQRRTHDEKPRHEGRSRPCIWQPEAATAILNAAGVVSLTLRAVAVAGRQVEVS